MRQQIVNYTFNASAKTITFTDFTAIQIERIIYIKNLTVSGDLVIYDPTNTTSFPGTVATNVLTFTAANAGMQNTDKLFIIYDTLLLKPEDSASADGDYGIPMLAVRKATPANTSGTDGDYEPPQLSAGRLWTSAKIDSIVPATSGGLTTYHLVSANSTNATVIKASAGQVFGWYIYNSNAAARKVAFHNASTTPTAGASIFFTLVIPPSSGANVFSETGIAFSTGIAITTVTDLTDAGNTAVALNDLIINIFYA